MPGTSCGPRREPIRRLVDSPSQLAERPRPTGVPAERPTPARRVRLGAVVAVTLALAFGVWLVLQAGGDTSRPAGPESAAASIAELRTLPDRTGHSVYWAGELENHTYELTRPTDGNVYLRYLPPGTRIGDPRPDYTTIGTYPRPRPLQGLRRLARQPDAVTFRLPNGGLGLYGRDRPSSVYLAYPGVEVQIEVYDPSPQKARRLARSGRVRPIG